jgi:hypothetical protein
MTRLDAVRKQFQDEPAMEKRDHDTGDTVPSSVLAVGSFSDGMGSFSSRGSGPNKTYPTLSTSCRSELFQPHSAFIRRQHRNSVIHKDPGTTTIT